MKRSRRPRATSLVAAGVLIAIILLLPMLGPYYLDLGITAFIFVTLALAFDLIVGRAGALSLAQPLFIGFGAYLAALTSRRWDLSFWSEGALAAGGAMVLALLVGIPSFRLSLHAFAIGTLGFTIIGQLVANNWISVTGGPLCVTGIPPASFPFPGGTFVVQSLTQGYIVSVALAVTTMLVIGAIARSRLGLAYTTVRDDPILADARGLWPKQLWMSAFALSAVLSAVAGAFWSHHLGVVCPTQFDINLMVLLLIMVFLGGRGSLRGVVAAALIFTVIPQVLRLTNEWRLVIFGALLLLVVTSTPNGLETLFQKVDRGLETMFGERGSRARPQERDKTPEQLSDSR